MRLLATLAFFCTFGGVLGCASTSEKKQIENEQFADSVKEEVQVGRLMAAKLVGTLGPYKGDPEVTKYINLIGQSLAKQSGRPELKYYFGVLDEKEANAFATPGGYVFLTKGLLKSVKSEHELATILGHEIAHINEKHMYKAIRPKKDVGATETLARVMSRGRGDLGLSVTKIVNKGMNILLKKGLGKKKEHAADRAGVMYAAVAGYNPVALKRLLNRMHANKKTIKVSKTHPPFKARISALSKFLKKNGLADQSSANDKVLNARFNKALKSFR